MGKTKEPTVPTTPTYTNSLVKIGDDIVSKTFQDATGNIVTQYLPTAAQQAADTMRTDLINAILPNVNTLTPDYYAEKQSLINAKKNQAANDINDTYTPILSNLKTDIASRFGNLANSSFLDELNDVENNRSKAIAKSEDDITLLGDQMDNTAKQQNMNYLNLLLNMDNSNNSTTQNYLNYASSLSNNANSFNLSNYDNQLVYYNAMKNYVDNEGVLGEYTPLYLK